MTSTSKDVTVKHGHFKCPHCSLCFDIRHSFKSHLESHLKRTLLSCDNCDALFVNETGLEKHQDFCGNMKPNVSTVPSALTGVAPISYSICDLSPLPSDSVLKSALIDEEIPPDVEIKMIECGSLHQESSTVEGNLKVDNEYCGVIETIEEGANKKQIKGLGPEIAGPLCMDPLALDPPSDGAFPCPVCPMVLSSLKYFKRHEELHRRVGGKHNCSFCSYSCNQLTNLRYHMRTHTDERPYKCQICNKRFKRNDHRERHIIEVHFGDSSVECEVCRKTFRKKSSLIRHIRIHTKEKPYVCAVCSKQFGDSYSYRMHCNLHTKSTLIGCRFCDATFLSHSLRNRHEVIDHTKQFGHHCPKCGKGFLTPSLVKRHQRSNNFCSESSKVTNAEGGLN